MALTVALRGGEPGSRAALATALRQALVLQAPDVQVVSDDTAALDQPCRYDLTLLVGLDPCASPLGEATDALLREALQGAGIPFQIVHGQGVERVQQALRAIGSAMGRSLVADDPALTLGRGRWTCENCSDPDCERRLFSQLVSGEALTPTLSQREREQAAPRSPGHCF